MWIAGMNFHGVDFPGRAGTLQREKATPSLIRELGTNYESYHAFLSKRLVEIATPYGGRPQPEQFKRREDFLRVYGDLQRVVVAEALLRWCRSMTTTGRPPEGLGRLIGKDDRLLSEDDPAAAVTPPPARAIDPAGA